MWNIASLLRRLLMKLAYCKSSKCIPLVVLPTHRCIDVLSTRQLRYQLHSVEGRAKCPTVPQHCELVTGQGTK